MGKKHFNNPNKRRKLLVLLFLFIALLFWLFDIPAWRFPVGFILLCIMVVAFVVFASLVWRCPNCSQALPRSFGDLEYCPYCGEKLETKDTH